MSEQVLLEIACLCAGIVALFAIIRLFSWVGLHVPLEIAYTCAGIIALFATIRFFSWMGSHVDSKMPSLAAREVALWTNKRFLSTVNSHVGFQGGSYFSWVAALVASVIFLCIRMDLVNFGHFAKFWFTTCVFSCAKGLINLVWLKGIRWFGQSHSMKVKVARQQKVTTVVSPSFRRR